MKVKHMIKTDELIDFFKDAKIYCLMEGHKEEIEITRKRTFNQMKPLNLIQEYVWVVINSGMKNQVAEKIYARFWKEQDFDVIGHPGKREAIIKAFLKYKQWFKDLQQAPDKIEYLGSLHYIGKITKYHLARNLGIDCAKPDRHLVRLAERFNFVDVQEMCQYISIKTGERIGVVDVILWRYCNLKGAY